MISNAFGGRQSKINKGWTLLPADALSEIADVLHEGLLKYGRDNWRLISREDHVEHAVRHLLFYCTKGNYEDLTHAATRLIFAIATPLEGTSEIPHSTD